MDSKGRVQDYRILSDSKEDDPLLPQVKKNMLIFTTFTTFRPALSMGRPTTGRAVAVLLVLGVGVERVILSTCPGRPHQDFV